ncbi:MULTISPECIES: hypothetical protein [Tatumella]|uniref:Uncharacterized protein n=1 Tax=Tatumella punctata TaxID=399969 RepID=A0ABW1VQP3_9GAMM|nr:MULTISPECIES: hypothetical protein [unclassified Tatumella]MBS0854683.1 hypothetical protein [Tatumella sp. JGM16]MBS0875954.1 hypothetical protein [Tatumella sp. JGM82]MBS0890359.1 hypothetical protein [Tatumella sp. JGM94]MBS0892535.1 hypothetical protein [Tatumella sp. JGM130]MBS0900485.1 hypothetical protein [Tatumella sp. JGM100]
MEKSANSLSLVGNFRMYAFGKERRQSIQSLRAYVIDSPVNNSAEFIPVLNILPVCSAIPEVIQEMYLPAQQQLSSG